ncbi:MAG: tetratricopeptide (TPR) repeat protein [Sediminicola sp.]|jgi:tetratricopeptide (TPR) repeat protein|tara:strand:+ start:1094 stop:2485 length:1392 start_codon:yes stop_codon:yes gene_type:complete
MTNTENTYIMKTKVFLLVTLFTFTLGLKTIAQADNKCYELGSLFIEPAKAKNYDAALQNYEKVVKECPTYSMATYQYAVKMFKHFIANGDKSKIADLEQAYKYRMQYYPSKTKEGDVLSDIAQIKYDNKIGTKLQEFQAFDEAFKKDAENFTSPKSIYTYFSLAVDLEKSGEKDIQEVFDLYDVITEKIEKEESELATKLIDLTDRQDAGETLSSKDGKRLKAYETNLGSYGKVKSSVDGKLGILADCPNLIPLYNKDFDAKKDDIDWIKRAASRLSGKDCTSDPLFIKLVTQYDRLAPSADTKLYLGQLENEKGNSAKAISYFEESASMQTDPRKSARIYYRIAEEKRKAGRSSAARTYYLKALEYQPSMGRAYLKIANMYAASANSCGSNVFEKRAIYWKAADLASKAARVDGSIARNARETASSYTQRAPSKSDIFDAGMGGKTITFNCWVGGSVKVPNL